MGFVLDTVFAESLEECDDDDDEDYGFYDENRSDVVSIQEEDIENDDSSSL